MENFACATVSEDQNSLITATPSQDEVRIAVFALDSASSPGPDGFGGYFYQKSWDIIADDVTTAIIYLFASLIFLASMNSIFVTLIPKLADSIRISDF